MKQKELLELVQEAIATQTYYQAGLEHGRDNPSIRPMLDHVNGQIDALVAVEDALRGSAVSLRILAERGV